VAIVPLRAIGREKSSARGASLFDSNVLVYRFDPRDPHKQRAAEELLRVGVAGDSLVLPHQALVELFAAVVRPRLLESFDERAR
jgi:predicted nucleic acid-binding protein